MKKRISALLLSLVMLLALTVPVYAAEQQSPSIMETSFSSGGAAVSHRISIISNEMEKNKGNQHIRVTLTKEGQTITHQWTVVATVGNSTLTCTPLWN